MVTTSSPNSSDCLVVVLFDDYIGNQLAFCKISDKSWTVIEPENDTQLGIREIISSQGKLYVLSDQLIDSILVYVLQQPSDPPKAKILGKLPEIPEEFPQIQLIDGEHRRVSKLWFRYLATDLEFGELLFIYVFVDSVDNIQRDRRRLCRCDNLPHVRAFQVFKLVMINNEAQWEKIDNLGDRILLQSFFGYKVMPTIGLEGPGELVRGNCIYFAHKFWFHENTLRGFQIGIFSMTENKTKYFSLNYSTNVVVSSLPVWFTPNI